MDALNKIDRDALLEAGWSVLCFGVTKSKCGDKGGDIYEKLWTWYVLHADHTPQWRNWDGGHWGHMVDRVNFMLNDDTGNIFEFHHNEWKPNVSKAEFIETVKAIESGNLTLFGWLSNSFAFFPRATDNTPWARVFA